jgi:predicted dehydrogenase
VLSEKPMATSLEQARELVAAATSAKRIHAIVQNRRYVEGVRRIRRVIADQTLGTLTALHCDFFIGAHFGGFREQMPHPLLLDMAIHTFDAARFMSGKTPLGVYCREFNPVGSWYAAGAAADALFDFSDGVGFTYRGSWVAEGARTSWESAWRVIGTRGTLIWDGFDHFNAMIAEAGPGLIWPDAPVSVPPPEDRMQTRGHASVIADFLAAVQTGAPPETASADNLKSIAMVFAAIESADTGKRVEIRP